jgi:hypothetical protein
MYTEERLFTYLQQFERDFLKTKTRIIDASEGGARKRGATTMTLNDAIDRFCVERTHQAACGFAPRQIETRSIFECLEGRIKEAREIQQIATNTLPLLQEVRDHLTDQFRVNRAIARIDLLRSRMDSLGATYDLVTQLTQSSELQRFRNDRRITRERLSGLDLQRRQIERDIENVTSIATAAGEFVTMLRDVIGQLDIERASIKEAA